MMSIAQLLFGLTLSFLFAAGGNAARVTMKNNCPMTVWPATLTGDQKPQLSTTGFELRPGATSAPIALPALWSGRFWARTGCGAADASGRFSCATGDCGSGQVACDGRGGAPPATLAEIFVAAGGGQDFYDVSNVDGFNLPVSVAPSGGRGECKPSSCPADIDAACPNELAVRGSGGRVIACKSACMAFGRPEFCCTGEFNSPDKCVPTQYSIFFENQCPQAYSYAYDDRSSTFTCFGGPDYVITFCP